MENTWTMSPSEIPARRAATQTMVLALAWAYWQKNRVKLISTMLGLACMDALFYRMASWGQDSLGLGAQQNLFAAIFFTNVLMIGLSIIRSHEADAAHGLELDPRSFLLPLPTWKLVLSKLFFPAASAGLIWIGISLLTLAVTPRSFTGDTWPFLGPALVASTYTAVGLAIAWLPLRPKPVKGILAVTVFIVFFQSRFGAAHSDRIWEPATPTELGALALFLSFACATALLGASLARRGAVLGFQDIGRWSDRITAKPRKHVSGSFRSPLTAHIWLELRQKGWILPFYLVCILTVMSILVGRSSAGVELIWPYQSALLTVLFYAGPTMVGCLLGRFNQSSREASIDVFRASRPLSDQGIAYSVLAAGGLNIAAIWLAAAVAIVVILGTVDLFLGGGGQLANTWAQVKAPYLELGWMESAFRVAGNLLFSWVNMALVATVFLTGRNKIVAMLIFLPYLAGGTSLIVFAIMGSEAVANFFVAGSWAVGTGGLVLTVAAFWAAARRRVITQRLMLFAGVFWLVAVVAYLAIQADKIRAILASGFAVEITPLVTVPGLLALTVAPLALAPLALSWNRHR